MQQLNREIKCALFDLDGVLVNSEPLYTGFWESIERLYPTGIPDYAQVIKGTNLKAILQHYDSEDVRKDIVRLLNEFQANMKFDLFPGAIELLQYLRENKILTAIFTSSDNEKMTKFWEQHSQLKAMVDAVVTGSMVSRSKPDPEGYIMAAEALGLRPEECMVVEDSFQGLESGRRSGAYVVGLATTNSAASLEGRADIVFPTVKDLFDCFRDGRIG